MPSSSSAEPPADVVALAEERDQARAARDFAAADRLRDDIAAAGWVVTDGPTGHVLTPKPPYDVLSSPRAMPDRAPEDVTHDVSVLVVIDGWPDDTRTCLEALLAHTPDDVTISALDLGNVDGAGDVLHALASTSSGRVVEWHVSGGPAWRGGNVGWSDAMRALLRADTARVQVWCELSSVLTGDAVTPLTSAMLGDEMVVAAGWRGVNVDESDEWRSFQPATAPGEADAVLGYLMAIRREAAIAADVPHPKAKYYRNADMEACFALRAAKPGARVVVPVAELPVVQERHRGYHDVDPEYRDRESARTYQRFLQRFRGRGDLLAPRA